ncbi:MAG: signal peptide peptidase SppA [Lentisphaeria bacterium]|jgi:protease-4
MPDTPSSQPPPPPLPPAKAAPGKKPRNGFWTFFGCVGMLACGGLLLGTFLAVALAAAAVANAGGGFGSVAPRPPVKKQMVEGNPRARATVAVVEVRGIIRSGSLFDGASTERILAELQAVREDPAVTAVILDMDTPGGEVTASDEIRHAVSQVREAGKPVVTCMRGMGASGGYFIASGTDYIVANRLTMTGSVGVIIAGYNLHGLMQKVGVEGETYKSGAMKDMLNPARPRTALEAAYVEQLVQDTFHEFADVVAEGRPERYADRAAVLAAEFADGRILTGTQALEAGLVDELGYFAEAVAKAAELAKVADFKVVRYQRGATFTEVFLSMKAPLRVSLPGGLLPEGGFTPRPGQAYYLHPACLPY